MPSRRWPIAKSLIDGQALFLLETTFVVKRHVDVNKTYLLALIFPIPLLPKFTPAFFLAGKGFYWGAYAAAS